MQFSVRECQFSVAVFRFVAILVGCLFCAQAIVSNRYCGGLRRRCAWVYSGTNVAAALHLVALQGDTEEPPRPYFVGVWFCVPVHVNASAWEVPEENPQVCSCYLM